MNTTLRGLTVVLVTAFGLSAGAALPAEDNYGAIATSDSGAWGYAYDYPTQAQAEAEALQQCKDAGCRIKVWFANACGAVAKDGTNLGWAWASTKQEAQAKAISQCGTGVCRIEAWACTTR
jgi:serine/threonine-protein kinase